jgi:hypothetical protein
MPQPWLKLTLLALSLPAGALAQVSFLRPFTDQSAVPSGPTINSVSTYTGVFGLGRPTNLMGQVTTSSSAGTMVVGGVATDMGWYTTGQQSQAFVDYSVAYNGNVEFSSLGGFDNALVFGVQTKLSPLVTLVLDGQAESTTYAGLLYEPTSSLSLAQVAGTISQLAGSPSETLAGTGVTNSPLGLTLYGSRRQDAAASVRLIFAQSRRTTWTVSTRFERDLPATAEAGVAGSIAYTGITEGIATLGFTHSLSRRSEMDGEFSYVRSYWMGRGAQVGEGRIGFGHELSSRWFARVNAGYGGMAEFPSSLKAPVAGTAEGGASIGAKIENSALVVSASRSVSDAYGLGAGNSTTGQLAWTWERPGGAWTLGGSVAYERLAGTAFGLIQGWMGQVTLTRRISRQLTLVAQGTYASDAGVAGGDFASLMRRGARLSLTWRPRGTQAR